MRKLFRTYRFALLLSLAFICFNTSQAANTSSVRGMVVTEQKAATEAGIEILRAGGNAIDAAVAVGYALAVVNSCCGNIGGGGFMVIHLANGKNIFINFREKAPLKAARTMFLDQQGNVMQDKLNNGYLAVAIPGTVLGLDTALKKYGTMSRAQVMAPAIKLAEQGYRVTTMDAKWFKENEDTFRSQPSVAAIFLKNGRTYQAGELLIQTDLANTLKQIAIHGPDVFYRGWIAKAIVKASKANGGILSMQDFADYTVQERPPIQCAYKGYTIISAAPPSSGGIALCEMLGILQHLPINKSGIRSAESRHYIIEAMRYGFTDRNMELGDPDFVKNPVEKLLSNEYVKAASEHILRARVAKPAANITPQDLTDTTHYSILDSKGNAVAVTYTINSFFGAGVIAPPTGFFLNDEMDDFAASPDTPNKFGLIQSDPNAIQPGKRPLSSMTPTIIMKDDKIVMIVGSPGGPRIISSVLLTILNTLDEGLSIQQAVDAPRFHYQVSPDTVFTEPFAFPFFTQKALERMGYRITPQGTWSAVEAIYIDPQDGSIHGANDRRRPDGAALGY